jgi:hypothetical protein
VRTSFALALFTAASLAAAADNRTQPIDPAAMHQLVEAVSLDVMSEASLNACEDMGVASAAPMRDAWVAWRERHQLAPLRMMVARMQERSSDVPSFTRIIEPIRQRVLGDPNLEQACAALARDWQGAGMDVNTLYPLARTGAMALVKTKMVQPPTPLAIAPGMPQGQVMLVSQIPALSAQRGRWLVISEDEARKRLGWVYLRGRVTREPGRMGHFQLVQDQGDRQAPSHAELKFDAEPWVGREVVLRGVVTLLNGESLDLADAALVSNPAGLTPSPLAQAPLVRKPVLLQRVTTTPGRGLSDKDLAVVVSHGQGMTSFNRGSSWEDDVRFLLRDGTVYSRTELPPDQLDVAASRRLEPQHWGRWRANSSGYELQPQDDHGHAGDWQAVKHQPVRPWPRDARLAGSFSRSKFSGSVVLGGTSSTRSIRFTKDGRFERSFAVLSSTGTLQAINGTVIVGSSQGDGRGSSRIGGGTVGTGTGAVGATSGSRSTDDGASRRGRYQFDGFALTLTYDDDHSERLLSFPVQEDRRSIFVADGSYDFDKDQ